MMMLMIAGSFVCSSAAFATYTPKAAAPEAAAKSGEKIVDAGNKHCPIEGELVSGKEFVTYKGVRYGLCCHGCNKTFLKNPEKYIAQMKATGEIK